MCRIKCINHEEESIIDVFSIPIFFHVADNEIENLPVSNEDLLGIDNNGNLLGIDNNGSLLATNNNESLLATNNNENLLAINNNDQQHFLAFSIDYTDPYKNDGNAYDGQNHDNYEESTEDYIGHFHRSNLSLINYVNGQPLYVLVEFYYLGLFHDGESQYDSAYIVGILGDKYIYRVSNKYAKSECNIYKLLQQKANV